MGRTGGGWLGGHRVPAGRGLIAQPTGSSLSPQFWGTQHTAAHRAHRFLRVAGGWGKLVPQTHLL